MLPTLAVATAAKEYQRSRSNGTCAAARILTLAVDVSTASVPSPAARIWIILFACPEASPIFPETRADPLAPGKYKAGSCRATARPRLAETRAGKFSQSGGRRKFPFNETTFGPDLIITGSIRPVPCVRVTVAL